ncbi:G-protein coupled receptor 4-like [Symphorus nematophorus]
MGDYIFNYTSQGLIFNFNVTFPGYSYFSFEHYDSYDPLFWPHDNYSSVSNYTNSTVDKEYYKNVRFITDVVTYIIICIGLPLTLVAIYALHSLVQKDQVAPIYIINLLISDILQLCSMIVEVVRPEDQKIHDIFSYIHLSGLMASVCFMLCVALERYLVLACPLWYRFRRTIKMSVVVCFVVWALVLCFMLILYFWFASQVVRIIFGVFFLLPLPLFIFFLVGTLRAMSTITSVPSDEKRRIVGLLVTVLLIYTVLFIPAVIWYLKELSIKNFTLHKVSLILIELNPLTDLTLYVFMRKGAVDKLLASVGCRGINSNDTSSSS